MSRFRINMIALCTGNVLASKTWLQLALWSSCLTWSRLLSFITNTSTTWLITEMKTKVSSFPMLPKAQLKRKILKASIHPIETRQTLNSSACLPSQRAMPQGPRLAKEAWETMQKSEAQGIRSELCLKETRIATKKDADWCLASKSRRATFMTIRTSKGPTRWTHLTTSPLTRAS